jgi:hypothetical protein
VSGLRSDYQDQCEVRGSIAPIGVNCLTVSQVCHEAPVLRYLYEVRESVCAERLGSSTSDGPFTMETTYTGRDEPMAVAAALLMTIPVAIIFFIFQKRIMNASAGAVKE